MMTETISSIKDSRVVEARQLTTAAGRRAAGKCLLEDQQAIEWAINAGLTVEHVFFRQGGEIAHLAESGIPCLPASDGVLKKISGTKYLIPVIGVAALPSPTLLPGAPPSLVIVLDGVVDHGNIGTIIRTARAFGIRDILTTSPDDDFYYRKIITASRGSVFQMRIDHFDTAEDTLDHLRQAGYQIVATSPHAPRLQSGLKLAEKPVALIVGNETSGVSESVLDQADIVVQIPMSGPVESLNVGVATGISVYEIKLKLVLAMLTTHIRSTLGRNVNVVGQLIQQALDVRLQAISPFNSTQVILMMVLKCDQTMTREQIGRDMAVFGSELENLLEPLLTGGYILEEEALRLSAGGEQLLGELWGVVEASEQEILAGFSDAERQQLTDYLQRLMHNCAVIIGRDMPE